MNNDIFNKIDTSKLNQIEKNLTTKKEENSKPWLDEKHLELVEVEPETPPCIHPAIHNYIKLNQFEVHFDKPSSVMNRVISLSKPVYNIRKNKFVSNKLLVAFEVIHETHYFGKPSRYNNFYTDEDVIHMVNEFNETKHSYMEVYEFDQNGEPKIKTTYTSPRVYRLDFAKFDMNNTENKYFIAEVHFTNMNQEIVQPQEPDVIEQKPETAESKE